MRALVLADGCVPRRSLTASGTIFRLKHNVGLSCLSVLAETDTNSRSIDSRHMQRGGYRRQEGARYAWKKSPAAETKENVALEPQLQTAK